MCFVAYKSHFWISSFYPENNSARKALITFLNRGSEKVEWISQIFIKLASNIWELDTVISYFLRGVVHTESKLYNYT